MIYLEKLQPLLESVAKGMMRQETDGLVDMERMCFLHLLIPLQQFFLFRRKIFITGKFINPNLFIYLEESYMRYKPSHRNKLKFKSTTAHLSEKKPNNNLA